MQLTIQSKSVHISSRFETYVQNKIERLERYLPGVELVNLRVESQSEKGDAPKAVELTVNRRRTLLRVEERASDIYAGFDAVLDKMYHRIARYKGRRLDTKRHGLAADEELAGAEALPIEVPPADDRKIVRTKVFTVVPMSTEEALEQMELIGHPFFLFQNQDSGTFNVLYRRTDGDYGLLQPEK